MISVEHNYQGCISVKKPYIYIRSRLNKNILIIFQNFYEGFFGVMIPSLIGSVVHRLPNKRSITRTLENDRGNVIV